jgi:hypothetical protein
MQWGQVWAARLGAAWLAALACTNSGGAGPSWTTTDGSRLEKACAGADRDAARVVTRS